MDAPKENNDSTENLGNLLLWMTWESYWWSSLASQKKVKGKVSLCLQKLAAC